MSLKNRDPKIYRFLTRIEFYFISKLKSGLWSVSRSKQEQRFLPGSGHEGRTERERFF